MRSEPLETSVDDLAVINSPDSPDDVISPDGAPAPASAIADADGALVKAGDSAMAAPAARSTRKTARFFGEVPLMLVICGVGLGLVIIGLHHFRWGSVVISLAVLLGALFRLVLPTRTAGLLAVRTRLIDVVTAGLIGGTLLVLAGVTSN